MEEDGTPHSEDRRDLVVTNHRIHSIRRVIIPMCHTVTTLDLSMAEGLKTIYSLEAFGNLKVFVFPLTARKIAFGSCSRLRHL
mmetsp:Transcript_4754/g.13312  ORF Transcript_4754/g.13312 Transcript_4754/m.13312 type:complete len:83 (+) Transcript_4754:623-871(+)